MRLVAGGTDCSPPAGTRKETSPIPAVLGGLDATAAACASARVARWREAWLGLGRTVVPMLVLDDGYVS